MHISIYSLAMAVFWSTVFTELAICLRKRLPVLRQFSFYPFLLILLFCIMRAALPLELPYTAVLESGNVLPGLQQLSRTLLFQYRHISITPAVLLYTVWIATAAAILTGRIKDYRRFHRLLNLLPSSQDSRLYRFLKLADPQGRLKNVKIIVHESVLSPAAAGFIHPVILLPDISFDDDELAGIFLHECAHFKYGHCYIKLAAELVCIVFWWNPLLKKLPSELSHALEMHSDRAVCATLNREQQTRYLSAIIKIFQKMDGSDNSHSFSCSLVEKTDGENLKQRFQMVLGNYYQPEKKMKYFVILSAVAIFLLSYAIQLQPYRGPSLADMDGVDSTSVEYRYYLLETDDGYDLYQYPDHFLDHINSPEQLYGNLSDIKVYKNKKDVPKLK